MKNIFNIIIVFVLTGLVISCNNDDDSTPVPTVDSTPLNFDFSLLQEPSCDGAPVVSISGPSEGILYYTIRPAEVDGPTAEDLVNSYGLNGNGDSSSVDGGRIVDPGVIELTIENYELNQSYVLYGVIASEYGYLSEVESLSFSSTIDSNVSDSYNSLAYSESVGISMEDGVVGNTSLTLIPGEENLYYARSLWGDSFVAVLTGDDGYIGQYMYPGIIQLNDDNTVTVLNTGNAEDEYAVGGTGTYDPCENVFNLELEQGLFTGDFTVNVVLSAE